MRIQAFDPQTASDAEWRAAHRFYVASEAEFWPEDPADTFEQFQRNWRNFNPLWEVVRLMVWNAQDQVVAMTQMWLNRTGYNEHILDFDINVAPAYRRQGLGRQLLAHVVETARREGRTLLITGTGDVVPAGEAAMRRLDAEAGMVSHTNQLLVADIDRGLMRRWIERAEERAAGYVIGEWIGSYPEEDITRICALYDATNDAPHDSLDVEDEHRTPEQLRAQEQAMLARGDERWSVYAREVATGELAGFTEIFWNPTKPALAWQGWTAVAPTHRNRGLGRWIKAAMTEKLLRERPYVERIRTGNADSNRAMLGINHEMGFKPYRAWTVWQAPVEKAEAYLVGEEELAAVA